ncbi:putative ethanolamine kinase [Diplonema papillatum]|nr:putative ethanolamine kinase [Diplonema papillatum]|eukprot:gene9278-14374_t
MRFGERLKAASHAMGEFDEDLEKSVLAYSNLKSTLKDCVVEWENGDGEAANEEHDPFWSELNSELSRLDGFYDTRLDSLQHRFESLKEAPMSSPTYMSAEHLKADIKSMQDWVELNHVGLVKIHKKYVKNAQRATGSLETPQGRDWGSKLPVLFQRPFFEGDNDLAKLMNQVSAFAASASFKKKCSLCKGPAPCAKPDCNALRAKIVSECREKVPGWAGKTLVVRILTGGLSNKLFTAENVDRQDGEIQQVVVRIWGSGDLIDKKLEAVISAQLSELNIGPKIHGVFDIGRIEQFVKGLSLRFYHLKNKRVLQDVAKKVSRFHDLSIAGIPKEPAFFHVIRRYYDMSLRVSFTESDVQVVTGVGELSKQDLLDQLGDLSALSKEIDQLEKLAKNFVSGTSLCHCDLQEGNILAEALDTDEMNITLIDFEYARYDYEAFDIGNFFCETYIDNFFPDYPWFRCHPSLLLPDDLQKLFLHSFLEAKTGSAPTEEYVEAWQRECGVMILASHLQWCLWAVIQSKSSDIEFCYLSYARIRLQEYWRLKHVMLSSDSPSATPRDDGKPNGCSSVQKNGICVS